MNRLSYLIIVAASVAFIATTTTVVQSQDFGFPEETGLSKDKQNANVSQFIQIKQMIHVWYFPICVLNNLISRLSVTA